MKNRVPYKTVCSIYGENGHGRYSCEFGEGVIELERRIKKLKKAMNVAESCEEMESPKEDIKVEKVVSGPISRVLLEALTDYKMASA